MYDVLVNLRKSQTDFDKGVGFLFFILGVILSDPFKGWLDHVWGKFFR